VTGWPMRRPIAKSEEDWSIGLARCITSESSVGTVEDENRGGLIPGDYPVLTHPGQAHHNPWAGAEAGPHLATCLRDCGRDRR
jgi:hypothetical protein